MAALGSCRVGSQTEHIPPLRGGHPLRMDIAEVICVGLGVGGQRAEDSGLIRVDVRQRRNCRL